jgi:hypothetical protein
MLKSTLLLPSALLALAASASAQNVSSMRDPDDGAFDISGWLATAGGFLPAIRPVTEPAIGYGGSASLIFLHRPADWDIDQARARFEARERMSVPSASGVFGMYTASDSWAAGAGHMGIWGDGRWRYLGGAGAARLNLTIAAEVPGIGEALLDYTLEGWGLTQTIRYRLGDSDFFAGAVYTLRQMTTRFAGSALPGVEPSETDSALGAAGLSIAFDSRNSTFTPDRGFFALVEGKRQDTALGGDFDYWSGNMNVLAFIDPVESVVVGLRATAGFASEGVPFWAKPAVTLRGVARGRYTGDRTATFATEVRWDFSRRWSVLGFGGAGRNLTLSDRSDDQIRWVAAGGGGFRYLLARAFGMRGGLDFAYGKDGFAFYVTIGSAWASF